MILIKGYAEAGALDGEHNSLYRGSCQLIEVRKKTHTTERRVFYPLVTADTGDSRLGGHSDRHV
jgi:hypothetical protein